MNAEGNFIMEICPFCNDRVEPMLEFMGEPIAWFCNSCEQALIREAVVGYGVLGVPKNSKVKVV